VAEGGTSAGSPPANPALPTRIAYTPPVPRPACDEPDVTQPEQRIPTGATPFHYAWVVAGITFVILLVSAGVRAVPAVLMLPLEQEFGWVRTTTSAALSVNILLYGLTGPFAGSLMARVGVRRVVLTALALLACGVATAPLMRQSWQLVALWGLGIGVGTGLVAMVLASPPRS
jgi:MFS family permease